MSSLGWASSGPAADPPPPIDEEEEVANHQQQYRQQHKRKHINNSQQQLPPLPLPLHPHSLAIISPPSSSLSVNDLLLKRPLEVNTEGVIVVLDSSEEEEEQRRKRGPKLRQLQQQQPLIAATASAGASSSSSSFSSSTSLSKTASFVSEECSEHQPLLQRKKQQQRTLTAATMSSSSTFRRNCLRPATAKSKKSITDNNVMVINDDDGEVEENDDEEEDEEVDELADDSSRPDGSLSSSSLNSSSTSVLAVTNFNPSGSSTTSSSSSSVSQQHNQHHNHHLQHNHLIHNPRAIISSSANEVIDLTGPSPLSSESSHLSESLDCVSSSSGGGDDQDVDCTSSQDASEENDINHGDDDEEAIPLHGDKKRKRAASSYFDDSVFPPLYCSEADSLLDASTFDDKEGHYIIQKSDKLTSRFEIINLLGQGTFGKVAEVYDMENKRSLAVKIIRNIPKYRDASKLEIRILNELKRNDKDYTKRCIHMLECFDYRNHVCMVFEKLCQSMFDFMKQHQFAPFPLKQIKSFGFQILEAVQFLHGLGLIHTDLKPENLMLLDNRTKSTTLPVFSTTTTTASSSTASAPPKSGSSIALSSSSSASSSLTLSSTTSSTTTTTTPTIALPKQKTMTELVSTHIKLIDFGSAIFEQDYHSSVVSTRHYRAPEIILGMGWSFPCDIWSVGCILVELFTGHALFQTHDNLEHLAMMQTVLGPFSNEFLAALGSNGLKYFLPSLKLDFPNAKTKKDSRKFVKSMVPLSSVLHLGRTDTPVAVPAIAITHGASEEERRLFLDLLTKMLVYDPKCRIKASEALAHPFFNNTEV